MHWREGDNVAVAVTNRLKEQASIHWHGLRVPAAMDVKRQSLADLPEPKDTDGEFVVIDGLQVAGRHCAASDKPIAFERDARLCPICGQVYLNGQVPKKCLTCSADLGNKAVEL